MSEQSAEWVGRSETAQDSINPALLTRYAATMGSDPAYIPLTIHWCLFPQTTSTAELGVDGHPPRGSFLPPVPLPRRMWAGSDLVFLAPLRVGSNIERRSTIVSITEKTGATGPLVFVKIEHVIQSGGKECLKEVQTIVYRGDPKSPIPIPAAIGFEPQGLKRVKTVSPNEIMLFRYSAITFNAHRIHYDASYVTMVEGYPALVVHGPLIASLLLDLAAEYYGREKIARFNYQAVSPAFAGQDIHLAIGDPSIVDAGNQRILTAFGDDGRKVMTGTLALR